MDNTIRTHLATAWDILAGIPVCGDNADRMAMARQELRKADALAKELEQKPRGEIAGALKKESADG